MEGKGCDPDRSFWRQSDPSIGPTVAQGGGILVIKVKLSGHLKRATAWRCRFGQKFRRLSTRVPPWGWDRNCPSPMTWRLVDGTRSTWYLFVGRRLFS